MRRPSATVFAIGFWHDTCLPAASAAIDVLGVQRRRAEDLDRVDVVVGEQVVERRVAAGRPPTPARAVRARRARVAQRDDVAVLVREVARHVERRDVADADDSDPNRCHGA